MTTSEHISVRPETTVVVQPDWIVSLKQAPIHRACLVIESGRVIFVGSELPLQFRTLRRLHLPNSAILPGLVNAHCHLEFSDLPAPLPANGTFPDWIRSVLRYRTANSLALEQLEDTRRLSIQMGIHESYLSGVRAIIDMVTPPWNREWVANAILELRDRAIADGSHPALVPSLPLVIQPCYEVVDVTPTRRQQTLAFAADQLSYEQKAAPNLESFSGLMRAGLAPHASYTASVPFVRQMAEQAKEEQRLVSIHLSESIDEMEWLQERAGAFSAVLNPIIQQDYFAGSRLEKDFLNALEVAWVAIIAHGNFLSSDSIDLLSNSGGRFAIAHCPRTFAHFAHEIPNQGSVYPIQERLEHGVGHLIGTDSRASNPDLNLWSESLWLRKQHPTLSAEKILRLVTTDAIQFLHLPEIVGTLQVGTPSSLTVIESELPLDESLTEQQLCEKLLCESTKSSPIERAAFLSSPQ